MDSNISNGSESAEEDWSGVADQIEMSGRPGRQPLDVAIT